MAHLLFLRYARVSVSFSAGILFISNTCTNFNRKKGLPFPIKAINLPFNGGYHHFFMKATPSQNEPTMQSMSIGEKMRHLRETRNLSQQNVADEMEMSLSGYAKMERGETNPSWKNIEKFAEIVGVRAWEVATYGEGQFVQVNTNNSGQFALTINNHGESIDPIKERIRHLETELASAQREIARLEEMVALLRKVSN